MNHSNGAWCIPSICWPELNFWCASGEWHCQSFSRRAISSHCKKLIEPFLSWIKSCCNYHSPKKQSIGKRRSFLRCRELLTDLSLTTTPSLLSLFTPNLWFLGCLWLALSASCYPLGFATVADCYPTWVRLLRFHAGSICFPAESSPCTFHQPLSHLIRKKNII